MYTIGIVCSGNTCRSPVAAAWLKQSLIARGLLDQVNIWTAGINISDKNDIGRRPVTEEALRVTADLGLRGFAFEELEKHRVRDFTAEALQTDLLVWISDPVKINAPFEGGVTRCEYVLTRARDLGATMLVIPEPDDAWEANKNKAPDDEVLYLYREQAKSLRRWSWTIFRFIPSTRGP